jgi:MFS family permease
MTTAQIALFTVVNLLNYLDRYLVQALLPLISAAFVLDKEAGGRLVSAFVIGYVAFAPVFGYLGDRLSRPKLMALGVFLWSAATIGTGLAGGFGVFFAVRILVGAGEASFSTIAPGYLKDKIADPIRLNSVLSIFFAAIPVGAALGYVVGGEVAKRLDWQSAFFLGGLPGLLLALMLLVLPDSRSASLPTRTLSGGLETILRTPILLFAIGGYVLNSFALNGLAAFVTTHGLSLGFKIDEITRSFGLILVVSGLLGTVGGGRLASYLARRSGDTNRSMLRFIGLSGLIAAPAMAAAFMVTDRTTFLVLCFVAELVVFASTAPVNSLIVVNAPRGSETLTQGVTIFGLNCFGALPAPVLLGRIADNYSLPVSMYAASGVLLLSGIVWLAGTLKSSPAAESSQASSPQ